ncbi:MAG: hypothetical protein R6T98_01345 [Desulfatiglandales bacterium]
MTDKLIKQYREKALSLDFKKIKLAQLGDGKNQTFEGPGYIEQNRDGALTYKLFHNSGISLKEDVGRYIRIKRGELIPEDYYFSFEGTDIYDRKWISERIDIDYHTSEGFTVVHEKLRKIKTTTTLPSIEGKERSGEFHEVLIPKKIKLPSNLSTSIQHFVGEDEMKSSISHSAAKYDNPFLKLLLFHDDDWLVIQIKVVEDNFHPYLFQRVLGALQYILAEPLNWVIYKKRIKDEFTLTFRPFKEEYKKYRFYESFLLGDGNESKIWKIFDYYLNHILLNTDDFNDPITNIVSKCLFASQGSFDAFSLTLSLAVEEILNTSYKKLKVQKSINEKDITLLKEAIKEIEKGFRDRICGFIGHAQQISASDRLRYLINKTPITITDYDNWKAIRNHFAHPDDSKLNTQDKADKTYSVLTLLHKLIFLKIGYQGPYNDFGERNWPQKEWKPNNANQADG